MSQEPIVVTIQVLSTRADPYSAAEAKAAEELAANLELDLLLG